MPLLMPLLMTLLMVAEAAAANGDLRLVEAARNRDQAAVRTLLNQQADVNVRSDDGATALLWAAHWNDLDTADLLIRAELVYVNAEPTCATPPGRTWSDRRDQRPGLSPWAVAPERC